MTSTIDNNNARINILIIGSFPESTSVNEGRTQALVYGLARSLAAKSAVSKINIISLPEHPGTKISASAEIIEGLDVIRLQSYKILSFSIVHLPLILRHMRKSEIVHIFGTGLLQAALLGCTRFMKIKCVWTPPGIAEKETLAAYGRNQTFVNLFRYLLYKRLERFQIRKSQAIIVNFPYIARHIERIMGGNSIKTYTIAQGIFLEEFSTTGKTLSDIPVILSIGAIQPGAAHHHGLEIFAKVKEKLPAARLIIAGTLLDIHYYNELKELAEALTVSDSIEFSISPSHKDIIQLLGKASFLMQCCKEEYQGMVLYEALASGLPVIATENDGIPSVISHGKNGLLASYGDINQLANNILSLLQDRKLYEAMSQAARTSSVRFDWKNSVDEVMRVYRDFN